MSVAYLPHCCVVRLRGQYIATTVSYVPICGNKANGYRFRYRFRYRYRLLFNVYCLFVLPPDLAKLSNCEIVKL